MAGREDKIGPDQFRAMLEKEFPGTLARAADRSGEGLLHLEIAAFRQTTEEAMDAGQLWLAEQHFRFIADVWPDASPELDNAIDVSYIEDLANGDWTLQRHEAIRDRMPAHLRAKLIEIHEQWK